jgi:sodium pump decarboxylase gamma subunit
MSQLSLLDRLADPQLIQQMTAGEKLSAALQVTVLGLGITFAVLILLWAIIAFMHKVTYRPEEKKNDLAVTTNSVAPVAPVAQAAAGEDEELIAVITAAIAASLQKPLHSIIVKNIKRVPQNNLAWANAAKQEQLDSRRF